MEKEASCYLSSRKIASACCALFFTILMLPCMAQVAAIDPTFNPTDTGFGIGDGPNSQVRTILHQSDGKIIIGGFFTTYDGISSNGIVRLDSDGRIDPGFTSPAAPVSVRASALQSDGGIVIAGQFTTYNGISRNRIARVHADGSLDIGFNPGAGANNPINAVALQSDGKIIIGGSFSFYSSVARSRIARLNADGSLDAGFDPGTGANGEVHTVTLQADGKIILGGEFTTYNGVPRNRIARLNANGSLDTSFDPGTGANGGIETSAVQSDGKIIIGGSFLTYNGISQGKVARLNADGSLDTGFTIHVSNGVTSIFIQNDGKIIIGGFFQLPGKFIVRLNTNGSVDPSFHPGTGGEGVLAIAVQSDGKILVGGQFTSFNGRGSAHIARLNSGGNLDSGFGAGRGADRTVRAVALQNDGKILIGGSFISFNDTLKNRIARLHPNGSLDVTFTSGSGTGIPPGPLMNADVHAFAVQPDGKILVAGEFTSYNGTNKIGLIRLNTNGTIDTGFNANGTGSNAAILCLAVQENGKIIIGGTFTSYNGDPLNRIARLNADGTVDTGFNPGFDGANGAVRSIALLAEEKMLIAGDFISYNGVAKDRIARLNADGSLDNTFTSASGNPIHSIALQNDGKIMIAGVINFYGGVSRNGIARLNADGTLDASFNPGVGTGASTVNRIHSVVLQEDGKIIIGGSFHSFNNTPLNNIARLLPDGSLDPDFDTSTGADNIVYKTILQQDGRLVIGGDFTSFNGTGKNRIARIFTSKLDQFITIGPLPEKKFGDPDFHLGATASSGLPVSYVSSDTSVAKVNGSLVSIVGVGHTIITASQPGNEVFNPAADLFILLIINKGDQTITFGPLPPKTVGDPDFALNATASSGLPVSYTSSDTAVATINGNIVTITGAGSTIITASQAGNELYNAAPGVLSILSVTVPCIAPDVPTIAVPVTHICRGNSVSLSISSGALNSAKNWKWYSGSCGGTLVGIGESISVSPTSATTYFVRGEGGCITPGACASIEITVEANLIDASVSTSKTPLLIAKEMNAIYQWIDCSNDAPIAGATDRFFKATESGSYAVNITKGLCTKISTCVMVILPEEDPWPGPGDELSVFPNPAANLITVDKLEPGVPVTIIDDTGNTVEAIEPSGSRITIDVSNYRKGVFYIIQKKKNENVEKLKLLIK